MNFLEGGTHFTICIPLDRSAPTLDRSLLLANINVSLVPSLSDLFQHMRGIRVEAWDPMSCDDHARTCCLACVGASTRSVISCYTTKYTISVLGELLPMIGERSQTDLYCVCKNLGRMMPAHFSCPRAIFTIHHPSYPSIWAYVTHVTLDPRLPLSFLSPALKNIR